MSFPLLPLTASFFHETVTGSILTILGFGFLLGLKHATEADHVVAVSTIVTEQKQWWRSALVGAVWGLGHTATLLVLAIAVIGFKLTLPDRLEEILHHAVGVMLILLGANVIRKVIRGDLHHHGHAHLHGDVLHNHPHSECADEAEPLDSKTHRTLSFLRNSWRSFFIGMMHGAAGCGALMLLVLLEMKIESRALGLLYVGLFGVGSLVGMLLMTLIIGIPVAFTARRFSNWNQRLQFVAGLLSIGFGILVTTGLWAE